MARLNIYVPDNLAARARSRGLNISALAQAAISTELERAAVEAWLDDLPAPRRSISHREAMEALDEARAELDAARA